MYAQIVPTKKLPKRFHSFIYKIPENLVGKIKAGSVIEAPFRYKRLQGIVIATQNDTQIDKKKIREIFSLQHEISLTKEQLLLAEDVADYYMVALPLVIASFLPKVPKKAWKPLAQKTS